MILIKHEKEYKELKLVKWLYYTGKMPQEEMETRGWEPFHLKVLRQEVDMFLDADKELLDLQSKIAYIKTQIEFCEKAMTMINQRNWLIRNFIEWKKFTSGAG